MIWQNTSLVKKLCWLIVLMFTLTACRSTNDVPTVNEALESNYYEPSEETKRLIIEQYEKDYAAMSDYRRALVDCGYLKWIGGTFRSERSSGGMRQMPEECPDSPDDLE